MEDLGEGSREPGSPPFLEAKLRSAGPRKIIFETGFPLLHLRNWMSGPGPRLTKIWFCQSVELSMASWYLNLRKQDLLVFWYTHPCWKKFCPNLTFDCRTLIAFIEFSCGQKTYLFSIALYINLRNKSIGGINLSNFIVCFSVWLGIYLHSTGRSWSITWKSTTSKTVSYFQITSRTNSFLSDHDHCKYSSLLITDCNYWNIYFRC